MLPARQLQFGVPVRTKASWSALVSEFLASTFDARPDIAVWAGRHEHDGRIPDWSPAGLVRERARLEDWRARASAFAPESLDAEQRFEREHLLAAVDADLFWLVHAEWPTRNPSFYAGGLDADVYLTRDYAPIGQRTRAYVAHARNVPRAAAQIRANLRPPLPRTWIERGIGAFGGLASFFADEVPRIIGPVADPTLAEELVVANAAAATALRALSEWLETLRATATDDFALGAERFAQMLYATERVSTPIEELRRMAQHDLERNLRALETACAEFDPTRSVRECVARVLADKPGEGPVEAARAQLRELRAFVESRSLVSIPGTEEALVAESPPHMRWNSAYISIPGPYETGLPSTYYIAPPDPVWSAEDREAYLPGRADLLAISAHEVWPGHFLHFLHANRARSPLARVFVGYAFAEGWAHYGEEMMIEAGLGGGDAEVRIGQLLNALLRNVRFVVAIGLHCDGMSVAEAERMFVEHAFQDPANARQQAARGTFDPAYLNYTLGKILIRELRGAWFAARGTGATLREFHDELLAYGGPPVPLVRQAMVGNPP